MTENKRYSFNWERGHPQFWDNHCDLADCYLTCEDVCELLNELNEEIMNLGAENTKFKLVVSEIIEDMQKYVDNNQLVYINQSYVDWIKENVDTSLYSQKGDLDD